MNNLTELLIELNACEDARIYAANFQTLKDAWDNCHRGDWMLWIYKKLKPDNLRELTLAKGHCAATVLHLMKDERSKKAVEVAVKFGEGNATRNESAAAYAADAYAAATAAYAAADAYAAAYAAATAAYAAADAYADADAAAYAAYAADADAYADADADADAARKDNLLKTAEICHQYLTKTLFDDK